MPSGYKFVIADDHPLFRGALKQALSGLKTVATILEAGDFAGAKSLVASNDDIDLVLLDLTMPGAAGLSGLVALRGIHAAVPLVVVSAHDDPETIRRALDLGASGFISKSASMDEIRKAVETVLAGGVCSPSGIDLGVEGDAEISDLIRRLQSLTPQQARVLGMLAEGLLEQADRLRARRLGGHHQGACLRRAAEARRRQPHPGRHHAVEDRLGAPAARRLSACYSAAAGVMCLIRVIIERSTAGFSGLLITGTSIRSAAARTSFDRSAVIRMAGVSAPWHAPVLPDEVDARLAVEVVVGKHDVRALAYPAVPSAPSPKW